MMSAVEVMILQNCLVSTGSWVHGSVKNVSRPSLSLEYMDRLSSIKLTKHCNLFNLASVISKMFRNVVQRVLSRIIENFKHMNNFNDAAISVHKINFSSSRILLSPSLSLYFCISASAWTVHFGPLLISGVDRMHIHHLGFHAYAHILVSLMPLPLVLTKGWAGGRVV